MGLVLIEANHMKPLFSEFSFGFGISHEMLNRANAHSLAAPVFPSLHSERLLGWDVKFAFLGFSLFLQFKRSDALTRSSAREWNLFGHSYFRFPVYRLDKSPQHNLLVELARNEPYVYYCAPAFYTDSDFNSNFVSQTLSEHTVVIPTVGLPLLTDQEQHYIVYDGSPLAFFSSIRSPIEAIYTLKSHVESLLIDLRNWTPPNRNLIDLRYLQRLWEKLSLMLSEYYGYAFEDWPLGGINEDSPRELVRAISSTSRTFLGAEWFVFAQQGEASE